MPLIPEYGELQRGGYRPAVADPRSAAAPYEAQKGIAQAVGDVGERFAAVQAKVAQARDRGARSRAEMILRKARDENALFRQQNPDETTWEADFQSRMGKAKEEIAGLEMSPLLREEITPVVASFEQSSAMDLKGSVLTQTTKRSRQDIRNNAESKRLNKDYSGAKDTWRNAGPAFLPEEIDSEILDIEADELEAGAREVATNYDLGILDEPLQVYEALSAKDKDGNFLNDPEMDSGIRKKLTYKARGAWQARRADEIDTVKGLIDQSNGLITEKEINDASRWMSDADRKALISYQKRVDPPTSEEIRKAWGVIGTIRSKFRDAKQGSSDEVEFSQSYLEARTAIYAMLPQGYRGEITDALEAYSPAKIQAMREGSPEEAKSKRADFKVEINSTLNAAFDNGTLGDISTPKGKLEAERKRRDIEAKASKWLEGQENPTVEDVRAYADGLVAGPRSDQAATSARTMVPGLGGGLRMRPGPTGPRVSDSTPGAVFPPSAPPKRKADGNAELPSAQGYSSDSILGPKEELDDYLDGNSK